MKHIQTSAVAGLALLSGITASAWELKLSENHKIDFHGFASQGYLHSSDYDYMGSTRNGSLQFTELGLNASYSPFARTRIAVQGFAFDLGDVGEFEPFLDYASIEYTVSPQFGIRAGRVRRPGGIYNHIQDVDLARTSVLLPQGLYDARWRDFSTSQDGGLIFGNFSLGKAGGLSYEAYVGMMHLSDKGGISRLLQKSLAATGGRVDELDSFLNSGVQLWWQTPVDGLRFGASFAFSKEFAYEYTVMHPMFGPLPARSESDALTQQFSAEYLWKSWTFQAEYQSLALDSVDNLQGPSKSHRDAWYVGAAYRFNSWFEAGAYYTEFYPSQGDRGGNSDNYQKDLALSLRFDPKPWWVFKVEGHYIRGTALLQDNIANPVRDGDGWFMFAAKTTFSF